ncbi:MAG TPA: flagellar hook-associated protein 3 [Desulfotomaculum sp.]|nr:flagellar hook-associated protein 3 [Desulfotomaculum sp.]
MRVTNKMVSDTLISNIQNNMQKLARTQEMISTGSSILRPSDDPSSVSHLMAVKGNIEYNTQYTRNIDDGLSYLYSTDETLGSILEVVTNAKTTAVQGANGTLSVEETKALAYQIDQMIDHVVDMANTPIGGNYIFAGRENSQPPFIRHNDEIYYRGGDINFDTDVKQYDGRVAREILAQSEHTVDAPSVVINTGSGDQVKGVFGTTPDALKETITVDGNPVEVRKVEGGILDVLKQLRNALTGETVWPPSGTATVADTAGINTAIGDLSTEMDNLIEHRVAIGARERHLESVKEQLMDQEVNLTQVQMNIEGVDIARASLFLSQQKLTYDASLAAGSTVLQTSLLHFLK